MAPTAQLAELGKRYNNCNGYYYNNGYNCNSTWYNWGRWVALVLIILFFVFVFFLLSCFNARRRRRRGLQPYRGTGWTATPFGGNKYNNNNNNPNAYALGNNPNNNYATTGVVGAEPVPPYSPPHNAPNNNYNADAGYYGGQQSGSIQPPQNAYHPGTGGSDVYAPPAGPPPGKGTYGADGVIR